MAKPEHTQDSDFDQVELQAQILDLEKNGLVTRTFRRLDPERQQAVVNAILEEAADRGPADLNVKQVAERANASVGSLYQYFGSRNGLMKFAVKLVVRSAMALFELSRPYLVEMPLREGLTAYIVEGVKWSQGQAGLTRFFARAAYQGDPHLGESVVRPVATVMRETIRAMLEQAAARGEIRPGVDVEAASRVVNALTIALADPQLLPYLNTYFQVTDEDVSSERLMEAAVSLVVDGIGATGAAKGKKK
jgi:TetR/AcrR family transcriptional regulator